jgi:hypothetical protein
MERTVLRFDVLRRRRRRRRRRNATTMDRGVNNDEHDDGDVADGEGGGE